MGANIKETPSVWLVPGMLASYGEMVDTQEHQHSLLQLTTIYGEGALVTDGCGYQTALLASGVPHSLNMQRGWVILIEPQSEIGLTLANLLENQPIKPFSTRRHSLAEPASAFPYQQVLALLYQLSEQVDWKSMIGAITTSDERITQLIEQLNLCFESECLKPESWRADQIAADLALSESRFLHLFKQQMAMAWRPYLLWRRLICAVKLIIAGKSATHAAYRAGFSDSAHLSRTFKATFGISIRESKSMFQNNF
ncbi:MAG TPA: AraC family transcriptional regulator [Vibrio sp.]|nr:AraC family transcriptional regulator [Vibrio sp.]